MAKPEHIIPDDYEPGGYWQLKLTGLSLISTVAGMFVIFALSILFGTVARGVARGEWEGQVTIEGFGFIAIVIGAVLAVVILHEVIHAALFLIFGARPRFGFKTLGKYFAAAYTTTDIPISRNRYLVVCLGPFIIITLACLAAVVVAGPDSIVLVALLVLGMNAGGSLGDFIIARKLLAHKSGTLFQDREDGFAWYNKKNA